MDFRNIYSFSITNIIPIALIVMNYWNYENFCRSRMTKPLIKAMLVFGEYSNNNV